MPRYIGCDDSSLLLKRRKDSGLPRQGARAVQKTVDSNFDRVRGDDCSSRQPSLGSKSLGSKSLGKKRSDWFVRRVG